MWLWIATTWMPFAQGLEHALELVLAHGEVAADDGQLVAAGERGPGVHAHRAADLDAAHFVVRPMVTL